MIVGKRHAYPESAAAGLYTTPSEYAQFGIFVMNKGTANGKQLLSVKRIDDLLRKQVPDRDVGLGVFLFNGGFGHGGANAGFRCNSLFFTAGGDGVIVMTNSDTGGALAEELVNSIRSTYKF